MSILVEVIVNTITTVGAINGYSGIRSWLSSRKKEKQAKQTKEEKQKQQEKEEKKNQEDIWGGWRWETLFHQETAIELFGTTIKRTEFTCPKCHNFTVMTPQLCWNSHYPRDHFHFLCKHCNFDCYLRTADDHEED